MLLRLFLVKLKFTTKVSHPELDSGSYEMLNQVQYDKSSSA